MEESRQTDGAKLGQLAMHSEKEPLPMKAQACASPGLVMSLESVSVPGSGDGRGSRRKSRRALRAQERRMTRAL